MPIAHFSQYSIAYILYKVMSHESNVVVWNVFLLERLESMTSWAFGNIYSNKTRGTCVRTRTHI